MGQPIDVARVALFLASADSAYVTGQSIIVDGGILSDVSQSTRPAMKDLLMEQKRLFAFERVKVFEHRLLLSADDTVVAVSSCMT